MKSFYKCLIGLVLITGIFALGGCSTEKNKGGVAVIDLDRIAESTGRNKSIAGLLQEYVKKQETGLTKLREELSNKVSIEQKKSGKKPNKKEQQRLNDLAVEYERQLRQEVNKVSQAADRLKVNLVLDFKKEVEPVARRVAQQKGLSVVIIKQNSLLYIDPEVDITDGVIDEMQKMTVSTEGEANKATEQQQSDN